VAIMEVNCATVVDTMTIIEEEKIERGDSI
jgi:hypothetical protein